jgi:aspartate/methionine/tyrosine aminotransferase
VRLEPFNLERYFDRHEFAARYLLSASDCEALTLAELLSMASPKTMSLWDSLRLNYTHTQGHPALRDEVAAIYETVASEGVLVAVPQEAIFVCMQALLGPGDHAIVVTPAYQSLYEVARASGCGVTRVDLQLKDAGWSLEVDLIRRALTPRTRLLVINFPHNPTGFIPARAQFDELIGLARSHGLHVFGDEMYRLLEFDPARRLPAICDAYERGISLSGLSKAFGLPGIRIGWLATRDLSLVPRWLAIKDYTTICHSAPSEVLAIAGLRARDRILDRNRGILRRNLEHAASFLRARPDRFCWIPPSGGTVAFPLWTGGGTVEDFCRRLIEERGVMAVPGSLFEFPGNHFRIGLGRRDLPEALEQTGL